MDVHVSIGLVSAVFIGALIGFFATKTRGFGKYTTSLLLLILVLFAAVVLIVMGKAEWPGVANLLFAVAGYAGGLVTPKEEA